MVRPLFQMLLALLVALPLQARAQSDDLYDAALGRIERNYLGWDELDLEEVAAAIGAELQQQVEWAIVEVDGTRVRLFHGDGQLLGEVTIGSWEELDDKLRELELHLRSAGEVLDQDHEPQIVLLHGVADALDRHSRILHGERLQAFDKRLKGTMVGIGVRITTDDEHNLVIEEVYEDTPSSRAGLQTGDRVVRIDGESVVGMGARNAVDRITGLEGTTVELLLARSLHGEVVELTVSLERAEIRLPNLEWRSVAPGIGYIRIQHFSEQTVDNLETALDGLGAAGDLDRGLVLDLRRNTGGSMIQSAQTADRFVVAGGLVQTVGRDGAPVRGLVSNIQAFDDGDEPNIPIVILVDQRTASGSEIVAGALRELDRAVLVGQNTYGKGTVQKRYTLDHDTAFKLTVARFLLDGELSISDSGLAPDLALGSILFDDRGVHRAVPRLPASGDLVPVYSVMEHEGWREDEVVPLREDPELDVAIRVLELDPEPNRAALLEALASVEDEVRFEEEARLVEAYAARGIAWERAPQPLGDAPRVAVELTPMTPPRSGEETTVMARVTNLGNETLYRAAVRLDSDDSVWRGLVVPIGRIEAGHAGQGTVKVSVPPGRQARESEVRPVLDVDGGVPQGLNPTLLGYGGAAPPDLDLRIALVSDGDTHRARIQLRQDGDTALSDLRVRFEYPESAGFELTQYDTGLTSLEPGVWEAVELGLVVNDADTAWLPLHVVLTAEPYGELLDWPVMVPIDGRSVDLQGPSVTAVNVPLSSPAQPQQLSFRANDDGRIDHLVVWGGGEKLAYASGQQGELQVEVSVDLSAGDNRFTVIAEDDQGLTTRRSWYVRGVPEVLMTDAEE